jgi:acyl carrier protein
VASREEIEERVGAMLAELLGVPEVGPEANFFELGGHSLLAVLLLAQVEDVFGVEVDVWSFFDAPTVRELAAMVELSLAGQHV